MTRIGQFSVIFLSSGDLLVESDSIDVVDEQSVGECSDIVVIIFAIVEIRASGEGICLIEYARFVDNLEIIVCKCANVACDAAVDLLRVAIIGKVGMIDIG